MFQYIPEQGKIKFIWSQLPQGDIVVSYLVKSADNSLIEESEINGRNSYLYQGEFTCSSIIDN